MHDDRVGEESSGVVQLSHGALFFRLCTWSPTTSLSRSSTLSLGQDEVDFETFQAVRQITLALDVLLELQNEAKFELAFPRRERRRGRPPDPARLGSSVCFAPQKIRHLSRPQSLCRTTPSKKKSCDAVRALPPLNCICVGPPH